MESTLPASASPLASGVPLWAWMVLALALAAVYTLSLENGLVMQAGAGTVHEFFHDGRHYFGVPCH